MFRDDPNAPRTRHPGDPWSGAILPPTELGAEAIAQHTLIGPAAGEELRQLVYGEEER